MAKRAKFKPDDRKLAEMILLIAKRSEGDPAFGAVKLDKLLFHCDFSAYLTYGTPIFDENRVFLLSLQRTEILEP